MLRGWVFEDSTTGSLDSRPRTDRRRPRVEEEAEEAALLGLIDFPESEEALEEELTGVLPR